MSFTCDYCQKGSQRGHLVSHAKNRTLRRFHPNLHHQRVMESGEVVRRLLCVRCLRKAVKPGKKKIEKSVEHKPLFLSA